MDPNQKFLDIIQTSLFHKPLLHNVHMLPPPRLFPDNAHNFTVAIDTGRSTASSSSSSQEMSIGRIGNSLGPQLGPCKICGDRASGRHYGVLSCDGCRGFFKRSVRRGMAYVCKDQSRCPVDVARRNQCQACRFRRCLEVNMRQEAVQHERNGRRKMKCAHNADSLTVRPLPTLQQLNHYFLQLMTEQSRYKPVPSIDLGQQLTATLNHSDQESRPFSAPGTFNELDSWTAYLQNIGTLNKQQLIDSVSKNSQSSNL
ncbi:hypothetical protein Ciccas_005140 [Cichlidogyrus casuarinus]|uniref:Nuclear receptor domain-containing protein n=1 Tax=Cichlidogyrus casuarinus TaxID=1844966 RepID=A0ABD2QAG0_9PLAT